MFPTPITSSDGLGWFFTASPITRKNGKWFPESQNHSSLLAVIEISCDSTPEGYVKHRKATGKPEIVP